MKPLCNEVKLRRIGVDLWLVTEEFRHKNVTVFRNFPTNGASTPSWIKWLLPSIGLKYTTPAVIHDFMYWLKVKRLRADIALFFNMLLYGNSLAISLLFFFCVRIFGWYSYYFGKRRNILL
jgi:hypothetical protein